MNALGWLWLSFLGIWKAVGVGHEQPDSDDLKLSLLLYLGIALLIFGHSQKVPTPWLYAVIGCFLVAAFARYELGDNFYNRVSNVDTGPYALMRHPIYTAVGAAAIVTALAYQTPQAYLGAAATVAALYAKAVEEENGG